MARKRHGLLTCGLACAAGYALWQRRESRTDILTGLRNRRGFEETLRRLVRRGEPFALCLLDVDAFKSINDRYGHPCGDEVLRELGRRMGRVAPADSRMCRFGGDEFAVFLTGTHALPGEVRTFCRRLREELRRPWRVGAHTAAITVSGGMAVFAGDGDTGAGVVRRADQALYRAKSLGEGRIAFRAFSGG